MVDLYRDFVFTRNTTTVASTDTAITVEDVSLFPSNLLLGKSDYFIAFESSLSYPHTFEICKLTNVNTATKTLTVIRGQAGTTAVGHAIVTYIKGTLTSDMLRRARAGFFGTASAPALDQDLYLTGDRFYNQTEGRYFVYTNRAGLFGDTFTRAASTTTMGNTETQNYTSLLGATASVPYVGTWTTLYSGIWGINATNQAYYVSGASTQTASVVGVGGTDFDISFDVFASTTAASDYGIIFRADATGAYGYYLQFNGTTATLYRINSGGFLTTSQSTAYTTNAVHTWRIVCNGNVITIYRDGTLFISYTEATTGFTIASATYLPGAYVGMRIGNATGFTDTSLYWDNFLCTYPGNTAVNTPVPQGWAPASYTAAETTGWINLTRNLELGQVTMMNTVDDLTAAAAQQDLVTWSTEVTLAQAANQLDDLRDLIVDYDTRGISADVTLAIMAVQLDEILDTLNASVVLSGSSPPSGTAPANAVYFETQNKRVWSYINSVWTPFTYAGPGVVTATIAERTPPRTANSAVVPLPVGSAVGDLAVWAQAQRNGGPQFIPVPSGFTAIIQGYGPNQYWSSWLVATKVLTAADITAGSISGTGSNEDSTVLRTFAFGTLDVFAQIAGNTSYGAMVQTSNGYVASAQSVTTTQPGDVVIANFMNVGNSPTFSSPSVTLSNIATVVGSTASIYTGDEIYPSAGTTTARTIVANGGSLMVGAGTIALKVSASKPFYAPMAFPTSKTAAYVASSGDLVLADATTAAFSVSLPTPTAGTTIICKKTDASVNAVTVTGTSALIDGAATFVLANRYDSVTLIADGTNWQVV